MHFLPRLFVSSALASLLLLGATTLDAPQGQAQQDILIPMDTRQDDHLKAYGAAFWALENGTDVDWLLNYRGGSFLIPASSELEQELILRGVSYEHASGGQTAEIIAEVESPSNNTAVVRLEEAPRIAVYAPEQTMPWDDAVLLALDYAEVPHDLIYNDEVLNGELEQYDWVHLHHEDFTGQYGKFYVYRNAPWYIEQQHMLEGMAREHGLAKVSDMKLAVSETLRDYVSEGGFLFAMCSGTETLDVALSAHQTDIVPAEYDGDPADSDALERLDYSHSLAFENFTPNLNATEYEHSDIDVGAPPAGQRDPSMDYFTLFDFSAQWDPVPTMLTQSHVASIKGFLGQTTAFRKDLVKSGVTVLAEAPERDEVKYLHGGLGEGTFTFYAGHDPEDYQHLVGDPPTDLELNKNSPGYRLILNNILFPAAQPQERKT